MGPDGHMRRPWCPATRLLEQREAERRGRDDAAAAAAAKAARPGASPPRPPPRTGFPELVVRGRGAFSALPAVQLCTTARTAASASAHQRAAVTAHHLTVDLGDARAPRSPKTHAPAGAARAGGRAPDAEERGSLGVCAARGRTRGRAGAGRRNRPPPGHRVRAGRRAAALRAPAHQGGRRDIAVPLADLRYGICTLHHAICMAWASAQSMAWLAETHSLVRQQSIRPSMCAGTRTTACRASSDLHDLATQATAACAETAQAYSCTPSVVHYLDGKGIHAWKLACGRPHTQAVALSAPITTCSQHPKRTCSCQEEGRRGVAGLAARAQGKLLQLALPEEVCPGRAAARRSATTGRLVISMPIEAAAHASACARPRPNSSCEALPIYRAPRLRPSA